MLCQTFEGIVIPLCWQNGQLKSIALACRNELEFEIVNNLQGNHLRQHIHCFVELSGYLEQSLLFVQKINKVEAIGAN